ncbi:MAG: hypothetical protein HQL26_09395 [Candidatus Omnitrophica bacterium]|nr:hypothetical protein [Candidatus Omnitrophota bacterium]
MNRRIIFVLSCLIMVFLIGPHFSWSDQNDNQPQEWDANSFPEGVPPPNYVPPAQNTNANSASDAVISSISMPDQKTGKAGLANRDRTIDMLDLKGLDINDVIKLIAKKSGLNIVASQNVKGQVSVYLRDMKVMEAMKVIVTAYGWAFIEEDDVVKIMTAQEYEERYGRKFGRKYETRIKSVYFAKASEILALLNQVKTSGASLIADDKSGTLVLIDDATALNRMEAIIKKADRPIVSKSFKLSYAKAADLAPKITAVLTPDIGKMNSDDRSNTLFITDSAKKMADIERMIKAFDQKTAEVLIEAKVVQITLNKEHQWGVDWSSIIKSYHGMYFKSIFDQVFPVTASSSSSTDSTSNVTTTTTTPAATQGQMGIGTLTANEHVMLQALDSFGHTDILSTPRITTINNKKASIHVGTNQPYTTSQTTTTTGAPSTTAQSANFIEVGIKLSVTPTIHDDNFITMDIKPEVSSVQGNYTSGDKSTIIPIVQTTEAETNVTVKDGATIVIGGLMQNTVQKNVSKVPILGDIPLIKYAFRNEDKKMEKKELVIFLKPTIITGEVEDTRYIDKFLGDRKDEI